MLSMYKANKGVVVVVVVVSKEGQGGCKSQNIAITALKCHYDEIFDIHFFTFS